MAASWCAGVVSDRCGVELGLCMTARVLEGASRGIGIENEAANPLRIWIG
jgi:hypothetical protein